MPNEQKKFQQIIDVSREFIQAKDVDLLLEKTGSVKKFQPLPRFPEINRDLALVVSTSIAVQDLLDYLAKNSPEHAESITLFDQYTGGQVGTGKKSLAFRITYRSAERSLTDLEVNDLHTTFSQKVINAFQAELR